MAVSEGKEALRVAQDAHDSQGMGAAAMLLGRVWLAMGRPELAIQVIEPYFRDLLGDVHDWLLPTLACAYVRKGDLALAESTLPSGIESMRENVHRLTLVDALRVLGMLRVEQARWDEANDAFEESVSMARAMPHPHVEAQGLLEWGAMHLRRDDHARARQLLSEALAGFEKLGAALDASRARQTLSELDSRS